LGHLSGIGNDIETAVDKRFHDSRADSLRSSGHDGCLWWAAQIVYLENVMSLGKFRWSGSEIRIQHDAVMCFPG